MRYIITAGIIFFTGIIYADGIDPTKPSNFLDKNVTVKQKSFEGFLIQSILISSKRKTAIINGQSLEEGDCFQGYTVSEIQDYQVTLSRLNEKKVIQFENAIFKKTQSGGSP